jgi:hypothetical protein
VRAITVIVFAVQQPFTRLQAIFVYTPGALGKKKQTEELLIARGGPPGGGLLGEYQEFDMFSVGLMIVPETVVAESVEQFIACDRGDTLEEGMTVFIPIATVLMDEQPVSGSKAVTVIVCT